VVLVIKENLLSSPAEPKIDQKIVGREG